MAERRKPVSRQPKDPGDGGGFHWGRKQTAIAAGAAAAVLVIGGISYAA